MGTKGMRRKGGNPHGSAFELDPKTLCDGLNAQNLRKGQG